MSSSTLTNPNPNPNSNPNPTLVSFAPDLTCLKLLKSHIFHNDARHSTDFPLQSEFILRSSR